MLPKPAVLSTAAAQLCFFTWFQSIPSPLQTHSRYCQWHGVKFASCWQRGGPDTPSPALHCGFSWGTTDGHQACAKSPALRGPAALRWGLEKYKERTRTILLPPDRENQCLWLLISTVPAPVKPNLPWKSPEHNFPGPCQESPVPNRSDIDLDLSWLCCPLGDLLQRHLAGAHSQPEFSPGTVSLELWDCKHNFPYMGKVADTSSAGKCLYGY